MSLQSNPRAPAGGGLLAAVGDCNGGCLGAIPQMSFLDPITSPIRTGLLWAESG